MNHEYGVAATRALRGAAPTVVEEVLRRTSPLLHMRRTAIQDVTVRDAEIHAGHNVVLWYILGNRDEDVFEEAVSGFVRHPSAEKLLFVRGQRGVPRWGNQIPLGGEVTQQAASLAFVHAVGWP